MCLNYLFESLTNGVGILLLTWLFCLTCSEVGGVTWCYGFVNILINQISLANWDVGVFVDWVTSFVFVVLIRHLKWSIVAGRSSINLFICFQLAARIVVSNLHKNTKKSFSETWVFLQFLVWFAICTSKLLRSLNGYGFQCRIKDMYYHVNERSGLKAPLVADDVYKIIMEVFQQAL